MHILSTLHIRLSDFSKSQLKVVFGDHVGTNHSEYSHKFHLWQVISADTSQPSPLDRAEVRLEVEDIIVHPDYQVWSIGVLYCIAL